MKPSRFDLLAFIALIVVGLAADSLVEIFLTTPWLQLAVGVATVAVIGSAISFAAYVRSDEKRRQLHRTEYLRRTDLERATR